ncbi:DUF2185 domain-containing protein [Halioxenophilus sp. WMMB6]|uniref:DUF2185 domain-containing protein n=1 Tax=Halioxenophilus sp. WMMB6 TaxID=3073815 RepID=UPI00295E7426|nr:DUF2185 domain-containing protein [Halioxenophilus sp. WMMB6]
MKIGYVIISSEIVLSGKPVGYFYREEPDNENDSGWRFFSGDESQEFADDPQNFMMYNVSTIVELDPSVASYLRHEQPVAFERSGEAFIQVEE